MGPRAVTGIGLSRPDPGHQLGVQRGCDILIGCPAAVLGGYGGRIADVWGSRGRRFGLRRVSVVQSATDAAPSWVELVLELRVHNLRYGWQSAGRCRHRGLRSGVAVARPRPCTTRCTKSRHSGGAQLRRTTKTEPTAPAMGSLSHVPKLTVEFDFPRCLRPSVPGQASNLV